MRNPFNLFDLIRLAITLIILSYIFSGCGRPPTAAQLDAEDDCSLRVKRPCVCTSQGYPCTPYPTVTPSPAPKAVACGGPWQPVCPTPVFPQMPNAAPL